MRRSFHPMVLLFVAASAVACASSWPQQRVAILPGSAFGDSALDGAYRWTALDGKESPVEMPAKSGNRFIYGTLDLHGAPAARSGTPGTYALRFTVQPATDTVRTTGTNGALIVRGDTLVLTPAGSSSSMRYRFAWRPDGALALTDDAGHVWVYSRR